MIEWLNHNETGQMVYTWIKGFLATLFTLFLLDGADIFAVSVVDLKAWLAAAVAAVLPLIINYLNPRDTRYGKKNDEYV